MDIHLQLLISTAGVLTMVLDNVSHAEYDVDQSYTT